MKAGNEHALRVKVSGWLAGEMKAGRLYYVKNVGNRYSRAGQHDYTICINGRFATVELKDEGEHMTPAQQQEAERIQKAGGGIAMTAYTLEAVQLLAQHLTAGVWVKMNDLQMGSGSEKVGEVGGSK